MSESCDGIRKPFFSVFSLKFLSGPLFEVTSRSVASCAKCAPNSSVFAKRCVTMFSCLYLPVNDVIRYLTILWTLYHIPDDKSLVFARIVIQNFIDNSR